MVCENTKDRSPLLPERHPQGDFFVCDIFDAAPKGDMAAMEHPIFSLSTKPDHRIRRYEHNGHYIEIKPSADGLATIHDRDVLIYCISQLIAGLEEGREASPIVRFKAYDLLTATNRQTDGRAYERLKAAMERLGGTRITTNIITGGEEVFENFGLIDRSRIVRETREGRMQEVEVRLSDWVFNAIRAREVLTLHRNYFRLRKPLERRMYELARKHCGRQPSWRISLELLKKKCGSASTDKEFKRLVSKIAEEDEAHAHMPDYSVHLLIGEMVEFRNRGSMLPTSEAVHCPPLSPDIYHDARFEAAGWDVHYLEREWRDWMEETPRSPDKAFLGFVRKWVQKRGKS